MSLLKQFLRKIQMENKEITASVGEETATIPPVKPSSYGEFDQLLGVTATQLCNIIINRSIKEDLPLNLMKLQRIMYLIACLYQRRYRKILYTERFQPWRYGPVLGTLNEFYCLKGKDISVYSSITPSRGFESLYRQANWKEVKTPLPLWRGGSFLLCSG